AKMWNDIDVVGYEYAKSVGYEFITLPDDELVRWQARANQVINDYIRTMVARGYSEQELLDRIKFVRDRIQYWTERQAELGIKSPTGPASVRL
ncbi:MAG TPA: hypothetical protein VIK98_03745, partial [Limnochordales bacterium]